MAVNLDGVANALVISTFVHLTKVAKNKMPDRMDHSALVSMSKIFAVPLSSFLWCLIFMIACVVSYGRQPDVPDLQLPDYHDGDAQPDTPNDQKSAPATPNAEPHLSTMTLIFIGHLAVLLILRFIFVVHSAVRLRYARPGRGAESDSVDLGLLPTRGRIATATALDVPSTVLVTDAREDRDCR
ncbi:hypothetical protein BC835DRAFT_1422709 [Cytidiella melzeri]|nr:hypothetical protein BC835DRAFT_1422709 [Cytidiella melzeri]